jgi:hypothetical protein
MQKCSINSGEGRVSSGGAQSKATVSKVSVIASEARQSPESRELKKIAALRSQ